MSALDRAIAAQRAELQRIETNGHSEIAATYGRVQRRLEQNLALLTREIEHAREAGIEVAPGWLFAQQRYQDLIAQLETETHSFLTRTIESIVATQHAGVTVAPKYAARLTVAALGPAPRRYQDMIHARFGALPARTLEHLVGYAGDGYPLGRLLSEIAPANTQRVKDALAFGVAAGRHPRVIAADVMLQSGVMRTQALAISRTETLRAYREASDDSYRQAKVVQSWIWHATLDERTCPSCIAQHGSEHPLGEPMETHPNCRCAKVPRTPSWEDLGFRGFPDRRPVVTPGVELFERLSERQQRAILGPTRYRLYTDGRVSLADLVTHTHSPRWGAGSRAATVTEALQHAA